MTVQDSLPDVQRFYRDVIRRHAAEPHRFGRLARATHSGRGLNPLCGDKIDLELRIESNRVVDYAFEGTGCAIALAAASMLGDEVVGRSTTEASRRVADALAMLRADAHDATPAGPGLLQLAPVRAYRARVSCATLAPSAFMAAIGDNETIVSTE